MNTATTSTTTTTTSTSTSTSSLAPSIISILTSTGGVGVFSSSHSGTSNHNVTNTINGTTGSPTESGAGRFRNYAWMPTVSILICVLGQLILVFYACKVRRRQQAAAQIRGGVGGGAAQPSMMESGRSSMTKSGTKKTKATRRKRREKEDPDDPYIRLDRD